MNKSADNLNAARRADRKEARQELQELRDLVDSQAKIIESMQRSIDRKVIHRDEWKRIAKERGKVLWSYGLIEVGGC